MVKSTSDRLGHITARHMSAYLQSRYLDFCQGKKTAVRLLTLFESRDLVYRDIHGDWLKTPAGRSAHLYLRSRAGDQL